MSKKECNRRYYLAHKERLKEARKIYYEANKDAISARCAKYYQSIRWDMVKKRYGIDKEDYLALAHQQNYVCAICGEAETRKIKGTLSILSIDHDHKTGEVRGLLCYRCNTGLGQFRDSVDNLQNAIVYLEATDG